MLKLTTRKTRVLSPFSVLFSVCIMALGHTSYGQSTNLQNESQVIEYLGQQKYSELQQANPSYLQFLDARCNGYLIIDMPKEKTEGMEMIDKIGKYTGNETEKIAINAAEFVQEAASSDFNFLMYKFKYDRTEITYYILGKTGKVLMVYPVEHINQIVNAGNND